jgi:hypothetical protein
VKFHCGCDRSQSFLAVDKSFFHVSLAGRNGNPLYRVEYLRESGEALPCSHICVHAHPDEFIYMLIQAERSRPRERQRNDHVHC